MGGEDAICVVGASNGPLVEILGSTFDGNETGKGAVVCISGMAEVSLLYTALQGNQSGGSTSGIRIATSESVQAVGLELVDNVGRGPDGALSTSSCSKVRLADSLVQGSVGGGASLRDYTSAVAENVHFEANDNGSYAGGALIFHSSDESEEVVIQGSTFIANTTTGSGGGVTLSQAPALTISDSLFCHNSAWEGADPAWWEDADGDGHRASCDCDDTDPQRNPDEEEVWYDGVDQDCDGASDYDQDADGHDCGDYGGDDCDDEEPGVHPGAEEVPYDGVDQDCDGSDLTDVDADGWEAEEAGGEDCADEDASIHPGATEVPGDGIDQDCDGLDDPEGDCGCATGTGSGSLVWLGLLALWRRRRP